MPERCGHQHETWYKASLIAHRTWDMTQSISNRISAICLSVCWWDTVCALWSVNSGENNVQLGSALLFNATVTTLHSGYTKLAEYTVLWIACAQVWLCHFWLPLSKMRLGNSSCTEGDTVEHLSTKHVWHLSSHTERAVNLSVLLVRSALLFDAATYNSAQWLYTLN